MQKVRSFTILPSLPEQLKDLKRVAQNMFWCWNDEFVDLFKRIDSKLWEECGHNPIKLLGTVSQARLEDLARNDGFIYQVNQMVEKMEVELEAPTWYDKINGDNPKPVIAYFSAEFGIHESLPIYSGGLGILAGDHLKSASDLGIPLVGVGLLYQNGYFRQYLNTDGWQQEHYVENDFYNMPIELMKKKSQHPLTVNVSFPQRNVIVQIWKVQVGRVPLYLLDTNVPENSEQDRPITSTLYGGDIETRIRQEIILGIGGYKALVALGLEPNVCHMNEGHAAFMALERVKQLKDKNGMTFSEAFEVAKASNVFTVHTPVPAGNDEFPVQMMDKYFGQYFAKLGINREQFLALGRLNPDDDKEPFKMPVLAIKISSCRNGVSKLHGEVSRQMWSGLWPDLPATEVPIDSITNGIHLKTWLSAELISLFERYLGANWNDEAIDKSLWANIDSIPDEEFWRIHQRCKEALVGYIRKALKKQLQRRGAYRAELKWADEVLDPEAFTIGFARRFATYKRGALILKDVERFTKILANTDKPVQFIFAGKAHPKDASGKEIIRQIVHFANQDSVRRKVVFVEDYDIDVARYLVQGVDIWLNNPRRPMEASGTSGMKAAVNGVLNCSTLDGWWCEGYHPDGGWIIGAGESYDDLGYQDLVESQALYKILEDEIIPLFYDYGTERLPREWVKRMKNSIKFNAPKFNTGRMVAEYARKFYSPSAQRWTYLTDTDMTRAKALSEWRGRIKGSWHEIKIEDVNVKMSSGEEISEFNFKGPQLEVGAEIEIFAKAWLGSIAPIDVQLQIYHGTVDSWGNIKEGSAMKMMYEGPAERDGLHQFKGVLKCNASGKQGFAVRVLPQNGDLDNPYDTGMIVWENGNAG